MSKRLAGRCGYPKDGFRVTLHPARLEEPLHWRKPSRIFVCSMADLFHDDVSTKFIIDCLSIMAEAYQHTFMILTKRPERMREILTHETIANDVWLQTSRGVNAEPSPWPLPNVWLGVTAENQEQADKRIPALLQIPAAVRFVSVEPMLGPVSMRWLAAWNGMATKPRPSITNEFDGLRCLDWAICGGESGPGARPMHPDWVRSLRDQCQEAGTRFFFKQWGEYIQCDYTGNDFGAPYIDSQCIDGELWDMDKCDNNGQLYSCGDNPVCPKCKGCGYIRVGKKNAGRLLDGRTWDEYPEVST
jgi:protein gp37